MSFINYVPMDPVEIFFFIHIDTQSIRLVDLFLNIFFGSVTFYSLGFLSLAHVRFLYRLLLCFLVNVGGISEPQPRS